MLRRVILCAALILVVASAVSAGERTLESYMELMRADLRTAKVAIITEVMQFTDEQSEIFWPIYREYALEIEKLNDEGIYLIQEYMAGYGKHSDRDAEKLLKKRFGLDKKRIGIEEKYFRQMSRALPVKTAVKFFQLEHTLNLLMGLQIAAELPFIE
jgi:hypothetical protein